MWVKLLWQNREAKKERTAGYAHGNLLTAQTAGNLATEIPLSQLSDLQNQPYEVNLPEISNIEQKSTPKPETRNPTQQFHSPYPENTPKGIWDRLAEDCESGGNWNANTGNGHYGGLQFTSDTWKAFGGEEFAPRADLASKEYQIIIAERIAFTGYGEEKPQGLRAWPVCSVILGLRQP